MILDDDDDLPEGWDKRGGYHFRIRCTICERDFDLRRTDGRHHHTRYGHLDSMWDELLAMLKKHYSDWVVYGGTDPSRMSGVPVCGDCNRPCLWCHRLKWRDDRRGEWKRAGGGREMCPQCIERVGQGKLLLEDEEDDEDEWDE